MALYNLCRANRGLRVIVTSVSFLHILLYGCVRNDCMRKHILICVNSIGTRGLATSGYLCNKFGRSKFYD
jgi:hypothetical protein